MINRERAGEAQLLGYCRFHGALKDLGKITLLPFDADAVARFNDLQRLRLRAGTMDLKIAAICLTHDATLLTRNLRDFAASPAYASRTGWINRQSTWLRPRGFED